MLRIILEYYMEISGKSYILYMELTKGSSTTASLRRVLFVLVLFILVLSTQISVAHCRALRSTAIIADNCHLNNGAESAAGVASFSVSSNNSSSSGSSVRSLMFQLASGPSKKGPGH